MAGGARRSADSRGTALTVAVHAGWSAILLAVAVASIPGAGQAQALYKYRGPDGEWIFTDRQPVDSDEVEVRDLPAGGANPGVFVSHRFVEPGLVATAENTYFAPVELILGIDEIRNLVPPDRQLRWVVPAQGEIELLRLAAAGDGDAAEISYRYTWIAGEPGIEHLPERPYRAPFAVAASYRVSQAFPDATTHTSADSRYAVDFVMPVGTDVHAARSGIVFEVTATNYRGGLDPERDGPSANLVRILHDDGTYAEYGHLNRSTIRVQPGEVVNRGQYIADSGNTGFSSGPHLHFAVIRNLGLRVESVPVVFEGPNGSEVAPETGVELAAY